MASSQGAAMRALSKEYEKLQAEMLEGFRVSLVDDANLFLWEVGIFGPPDTLYAGGYFRAHLRFPPTYPFSPPTMCFMTKFWHPNVFDDGLVCISILHPPCAADEEDDEEGPQCERWNPTQNVRTILLSVISLLNEPNIMEPANGMAAFMYRQWRESKGGEYEEKVLKQVQESAEEARRLGIKIPRTREEYCVQHQPDPKSETDDSVFLTSADSSDAEEDFYEEEEDDEPAEMEEQKNGALAETASKDKQET